MLLLTWERYFKFLVQNFHIQKTPFISQFQANLIQTLICKGCDPFVIAKDGSLPFHFFVERGLKNEGYNVTEDLPFLDMVFDDLLRNVPNDYTVPSVNLVYCVC